jgi:hypothetical protein
MRNDLQLEGFHIDVSLQEGNLAKNIYIYLFIYVFIYLFIYIQHFLTVNIYLVI